MNATQRKHVLKRLRELRLTKVDAFRDKIEKEFQKDVGKLTYEVLVAGIKDGSIGKHKRKSLKKELNVGEELADVFDLKDWDEDEVYETVYEKSDQYSRKLQVEIDRIEDELILGDAQDAMAMIAAFEKFSAK